MLAFRTLLDDAGLETLKAGDSPLLTLLPLTLFCITSVGKEVISDSISPESRLLRSVVFLLGCDALLVRENSIEMQESPWVELSVPIMVVLVSVFSPKIDMAASFIVSPNSNTVIRSSSSDGSYLHNSSI